MILRLKISRSTYFKFVIFSAVILLLSQNVLCDEARAVVLDSVSHGQQEVVPPNTDELTKGDDGPLVEQLYPDSAGTSPATRRQTGENTGDHGSSSGIENIRFQIFAFDFGHVSTPMIISVWIIIAGFSKIGFIIVPKLHRFFPESCILIVVGVLIGLVLFYAELSKIGSMTPTLFFLYLLPPIVLDAGYHMPNRLFFDNLPTILLYAVIGTIWNAMTVGASMWAVGMTGLYGFDMPVLHSLLFGSIVAAVDPVAVLAVFEEIHVNDLLYILVFGESLLNDAVTVVLYNLFEKYSGMENIMVQDIFAGVASLFVVALGGTFIGILFGIFTSFLSRFTHHVRVIEPLFIFVMAYLAYLTAEMVKVSAILSLTFCGITMKNYVEENISVKSRTTVKYTMKMLASSSETIIFMFLGVSTVNNNDHDWNTWFVVLTIVFCTIYRSIGVVLLTFIANHFRLHRLNKLDQFILAYGGLRGAVAFALVLIISEQVIPTKKVMTTAIICMVYFTVFVQGVTIGPLVRILNVPTSSKVKLSMNQRLHTRLVDHLMAGLEDICGHMMGNYKVRDKFKYYNNKYFRPLLTRNPAGREPKIFETYSKLNLADAMDAAKKNGASSLQTTANYGNMSFSNLLRSYTQSNLTKLYGDVPYETNEQPEFNFDLGELDYNPSHKDMADSELHHILSDAMFKPQKRVRKYSRSHIHENSVHPPFRHQMRMQIRHLVSEDNKRKKKSKNHLQPGVCAHKKKRRHPEGSHNSSLALSPNGRDGCLLGDDSSVSTLSPIGSIHDVSGKTSEDEGIVFTARPGYSPPPEYNSEINKMQKSSEPQTVTESTLPWKRGEEEEEGSSSVRKQHEFPSWIENKDYHPYTSPTNTYLEHLGQPSPKPDVFEVFNIPKVNLSVSEAIEEGEESADTSSTGTNPAYYRLQQERSRSLASEGTNQTQETDISETNAGTEVIIEMGVDKDAVDSNKD